MVTIIDVARAAGVTPSTVSHALSGKRKISAETKARIDRAIAELGYTANARARGLATRRTSTIALSIPFSPDEFALATMQYVLSVAEAARETNDDVLLVTESEGAAGVTRVTASGLVDGVVLLDVRRQDERVRALAASGKPGVLLGVPDEEVSFDIVDLDYRHAGGALIEHLWGLGHRSVAFVMMPQSIFDEGLGFAWRFRAGVVAKASELGVALVPVEGDADVDRVFRAIAARIEEHTEVSAILVHNDAALAGLREFLASRSLRIPEDLSVLSLHSDQLGRLLSLPYTSLQTSVSDAAKDAVRLLSDRIEGSTAPFVRQLLTGTFTDRGTTAPPRRR